MSGNVLAQHPRGLGSVLSTAPPALSPTPQQQWCPGTRSETGSVGSSRRYTATPLCASGPHNQVHGSSSVVVFNDLSKELSFRSLIFLSPQERAL